MFPSCLVSVETESNYNKMSHDDAKKVIAQFPQVKIMAETLGSITVTGQEQAVLMMLFDLKKLAFKNGTVLRNYYLAEPLTDVPTTSTEENKP